MNLNTLPSNSRLLGWINWSYALLFALLPFSLPVTFTTHQLELPSEPLLAVLSLLLLLYFYRYGWWPRSFYQSPLTIFSLGFIGWMGLCIPFSSNWIVSLKYWIVAATHWWVFYHGLKVVLLQGLNSFLPLVKKYTLGFTLIILYAWTVHAQYDFRIDASVLTARPFYFDHAMYSAVLLLLIALVYWFDRKETTNWKNTLFWLNVGWGLVLAIGVYLSFSRAAWLSAMAAMSLVLMIYFFRLQFRHFVVVGIIISLALVMLAPVLSEKLSNNQAQSKQGTLWEQLISTANITTDVSNLERLNRYSCAIRMTQDNPWTGFGPGTFQFAYLDYQRPAEMTRISVTTAGKHREGKGGGAHSEYLQSFAEMGITGGLWWMGIAISMLWTAMRVYPVTKQKIILSLLFGLTTFFVHALFNNFLHHGKVAVLVWSCLVVLNVIDISHSKRASDF